MPVEWTENDAASAAGQWLAGEIASRHERAARGLTGRPAADPDVSVPVVMRVFDPGSVLAGAVAFAAALSTADADAWFRCYTRALFLFGNPNNLAARHPPAVVAGSRDIAWLGVCNRRRTDQIRRLLRPVSGELPSDARTLDAVVNASGYGPVWRMWVAVRGLDIPRYLVHLHHTAAEAVLTEALPPRAVVSLRHVDDLDPIRAGKTDYTYARVHLSSGDRPRLFTLLTREDDAAPTGG